MWLCFSLYCAADGLWCVLIVGPFVAMLMMAGRFGTRMADARRVLTVP